MLKTRVLSALILAPLVLADIYLGGIWLDAMMLVAAGLMGWEWARLSGNGKFLPGGILVILTLIGVPLAFAWGLSQHALLELLVGTLAVLVVNLVVHRPQALWFAAGTFYIGLGVLSFLWLRAIPDEGRGLIFWLLAVVWSVDIGAYFAGRGIGGPKLAPAISPNKTWAGLIGGAVCAALVSGTAATWLDRPVPMMVLAGLVLAVIAQAGDLLESWCKRRFGVKDSSHIIPGHGGILDRVDGLLAVLPVVFVFIWFSEVRV